MKNIGTIIRALQNIMRKDPGVSGDAQRIEQLGWMISLKVIDDKHKEIVDVKGYKTEVYKIKKRLVESIYKIKIIS